MEPEPPRERPEADRPGNVVKLALPNQASESTRPRRRWARRTLLVVLAAVILLSLDAAWVAISAVRDAHATRANLTRGASALLNGDLDLARRSFQEAGDSADGLRSMLVHPASLILGLLPSLNDDYEAARALAGASDSVADAGLTLVEAARAVGWDGSSIPGMTGPGQVDLDLVREAAPALARADAALEHARALLLPIRLDGLLGWTRDAVILGRGGLDQRQSLIGAANNISELLPSFLGGDAPRHYLLLLQHLSDPRGSGGFPGAFAVLTASDGTISVSRFKQSHALPSVPPVDAPQEIARRYQALGALTDMRGATYPPDFPESANLAMNIYAAATGEALDGVIAADPVWMAYLLKATGPIATSAWPEPLTAHNITDVIDRQTFLLPPDESNKVQDALGAALWNGLLKGNPAPAPFAHALVLGVQERHLQVYSADPAEESLLDSLGAAGRYELGSNALGEVIFGDGPHRTGYFLRTEITYTAELEMDGSANVTVVMTLHNEAPSGPPSNLLGSEGTGEPVGDFLTLVNSYLPLGARSVLATVDGEFPPAQESGTELGHRVLTDFIQILSGETAALTVTYQLPAADSVGIDRTFELRLVPQPALRPPMVSVGIVLPESSTVLSVTGFHIGQRTAAWQGELATPVNLRIDYRIGT